VVVRDLSGCGRERQVVVLEIVLKLHGQTELVSGALVVVDVDVYDAVQELDEDLAHLAGVANVRHALVGPARGDVDTGRERLDHVVLVVVVVVVDERLPLLVLQDEHGGIVAPVVVVVHVHHHSEAFEVVLEAEERARQRVGSRRERRVQLAGQHPEAETVAAEVRLRKHLQLELRLPVRRLQRVLVPQPPAAVLRRWGQTNDVLGHHGRTAEIPVHLHADKGRRTGGGDGPNTANEPIRLSRPVESAIALQRRWASTAAYLAACATAAGLPDSRRIRSAGDPPPPLATSRVARQRRVCCALHSHLRFVERCMQRVVRLGLVLRRHLRDRRTDRGDQTDGRPRPAARQW